MSETPYNTLRGRSSTARFRKTRRSRSWRVGPETLIPEEPGQTLKTYDRLQIGSYEITFLELCTWLNEMGRCADQISKFERSPQVDRAT